MLLDLIKNRKSVREYTEQKISKDDLVSGIIYIGTAAKAIPPRAEIQTSDFVSYWNQNN